MDDETPLPKPIPISVPPPAAPAAPANDVAQAKPTPVLGPLADLMQSRKAVATIVVIVGTFVLVGLGRVTWDQAKAFLAILIPAWLGAHALQEGLSAKAEP